MTKRSLLDIREVYFVQAFELRLIKIGVTNDTQRRVVSMQTLSPDRLVVLGVQLCNAGGVLEEQLHRKFAEHRQHGEWFSPAPSILSYIEENAVKLSDVAAQRAALQVEDRMLQTILRKKERRQDRWLRANGFAHLSGV